MPRPARNQSFEKAKNFKSAIIRLVKELNVFKGLIILSLLLAAIGSLISIFAPNILSDLTDEISAGVALNRDNVTLLSQQITDNLQSTETKKKIIDILDIDSKAMQKLLGSSEISPTIKENLQKMVQGDIAALNALPEETLREVLTDTTYEGSLITSDDKIAFLKALNKEGVMPSNIFMLLSSDITIDNQVITPEMQASLLGIMGSMDNVDAAKIYAEIGKLDKTIQNVLAPKMNLSKIKNISILMFLLYLISAMFNYIEAIAMTNVSNNFAFNLRRLITEKINRLPLKFFDLHATGDILSRITNDVDMIAQSLNQSLATLVSAITLFVGSLFMMFITNWIMAITAILSSLVGFIFMFAILGNSQKYFIARQKELGALNAHIEEIYTGLNVVKSYNGIDDANTRFDELNNRMFDANRKSQFLSGLMPPMMHFIGNLGYVAVCIVGALLTMNNQISFGVIVAFIAYVRLFSSPLSQIAQAMTSLQSVAAASERVYEFLDEEEMASEENLTDYLANDEVKGQIEFKNVTFKYVGNDVPTIKNFSAKCMPGQKIAIVGPTGAGKTTMVNLLMKFYDIDDGDILIDGISTKQLPRANIHKLFTMVLQDTWLFNGTIKENIIYNRENVSDEKIKEVCRIVGLDHFIRTLPKGYNSIISDNDAVSAGQRQLLTIARGMIEDAPFLILDEATSNVDTRTEELVSRAMDKLTEGKTSFIIAHRLSTIKNADLILVMKDGNIVEQGNHEELLKKQGFYAELYNSQFEL